MNYRQNLCILSTCQSVPHISAYHLITRIHALTNHSFCLRALSVDQAATCRHDRASHSVYHVSYACAQPLCWENRAGLLSMRTHPSRLAHVLHFIWPCMQLNCNSARNSGRGRLSLNASNDWRCGPCSFLNIPFMYIWREPCKNCKKDAYMAAFVGFTSREWIRMIIYLYQVMLMSWCWCIMKWMSLAESWSPLDTACRARQGTCHLSKLDLPSGWMFGTLMCAPHDTIHQVCGPCIRISVRRTYVNVGHPHDFAIAHCQSCNYILMQHSFLCFAARRT